MTEQTKVLLTSKNVEVEVLKDKVQLMSDDIKNITLILIEMKESLDIHEERIINTNSNEAIDEMNEDLENSTVVINELTDEVSKFKVGVNTAYKKHADIIIKSSLIIYNLDSELFYKVFGNT